MSVIAPFFSARARERRAARAALRKQLPGSAVELVLPYPFAEVAPGEFRQPMLLTASDTEVGLRSLDGAETTFRAPWSSIAPITVEYAPESTIIPIMVIAAGGEPLRFLGVHGTGMFGLSIAQLRRMVRRIERKRPA